MIVVRREFLPPSALTTVFGFSPARAATSATLRFC